MRTKTVSETNIGATIRFERVVKISGLSDSWLRSLIAQGYLPKPVNSELPLDETFAGIIRYYQEQADKNKSNLQLTEKRQSVADEDAALKRTKRLKLENQLIARDAVQRVWSAHIIAARGVLLQSSLSPKERDRVLKELSEIKLEEYLEK